MKKIIVAMAIFCLGNSLLAQEGTNEIFSSQAISFGVTPELRDINWVDLNQLPNERHYIVPNKLRRNKAVNPDALPNGMDPVLQRNYNTHTRRVPIVQWEGIDVSDGQATPPDPSGAVGPNHYFEMVNLKFEIFDRTGNSLLGPNSLGSLWSTIGGGNVNNGDPIVMYDKYVDRWFVSQFRSSNNALLVAVSTTNDPQGSYYTYEFPLGSSFPDYPKYSIWTDGYYVTSNKSGDQSYAMERDKMITGDPTAQIVGFTIPQIVTPGFFGALPSHAAKTLPPLGTPCYLFYYQDDAWGGGITADHMKIWEIDVDWVTPSNSTISTPVQIPVSAFDSEFQSSWNDIEQPGTSAKLDGIPGALMYPASYMQFGSYNSVVINHTVDVNGNDHAGIRWYEFRESGGTWTLFQEGTYSPDNQNRWNGSICQDEQGNIGLAYSVSGSTVFPSIRYTGRLNADPVGQLTVTETNVFTGTSVQTNTNRFGDYAHMSLDPVDSKTFWYVGEYISSGWKTGIFSFKLATDFNDDVGVTSINTPVDGSLTGTESIQVTVTNFGLNDQSNFPVSYTVDGGAPITETYTGTLSAGANNTFTFTGTSDMSVLGAYDLVSYTGLVGDQGNNNDTTSITVNHLYTDDVGVTSMSNPVTGPSLGVETITVMIENFGTASQNNFDVAYSVDGGIPVVETITTALPAGGSVSYSFTGTYDFSNIGVYNIEIYTSLAGDQDNSNDTINQQVEKEYCLPSGDCGLGDGFESFQLGTINNSTNCSSNGYGDYTSLSTDLVAGISTDLTISSGYTQQQASVWIDFNDNFVFEASERVVTNFNFSTIAGTTPIAIPLGAVLGQHLLRARSNWQAGITDPCSDVSYGETEDYKVNIVSPNASLDENQKDIGFVVVQLDENNFKLILNGFNDEVSIKVLNSIGQEVYASAKINVGNKYEHIINLGENASGFYLVKVYNKNINRVNKIVKK